MSFIIENWYIILGVLVGLGMVGFTAYTFLGLPTKEQVHKIQQWLILAVSEAERELGSGTGQLKLRQVYSVFLNKFPMTSKIVSFETFSLWVDDALKAFNHLLETNQDIEHIVKLKSK